MNFIRHALSALLLTIVAPVPADVLLDAIQSGGTGWHCGRVVDGEWQLISAHAQQHKAITKCQTEKLKDLDGDYRVRPIGEIRIVITREAAAQLFPVIPQKSPPESGTPPAGWQSFALQGVTIPYNSFNLAYDSAAETFTVGVNGGRIYGNDDAFVGYQYETATTGDVTLTVEVQDATQVGSISNKSGIMLREDITDDGSEHCILNVFGLNGTLIDCRNTTDGLTTSDYFASGQVALPECFKIEVDRDIPSVKYLAKTDGADCSTGTYTELLQNFPAWAGTATPMYLVLATTPSDTAEIGKNAFTVFDQVTVSTASVTHTPGNVNFSPTTYQVSEEVTPLTLTVERTGDGSGACTIDYSLTAGTAVAGTDYTDTSGTLSWADAETGNKTFNVTIIDRNAVTQGNKQFTSTLAINSCSDAITNGTATVTILDQDPAGATWSAHTPTASILKDYACHGCPEWDTFVDTGPTYTIKYVTNLAASGAGSFLDCISTTVADDELLGCIIAVAGVAEHGPDAVKTIRTKHIAILGQFAPSPGFGVRGLGLNFSDIEHLLIEHVSFWGDGSSSDRDQCFNLSDKVVPTNTNLIFRNVSCFFSEDDPFNLDKGNLRVTVTQSMLGYGLDATGTPKVGKIGADLQNDSNDVLIDRNVGFHYIGRCWRWLEIDNGIQSNNVCNNGQDRHTEIDFIDTTGMNQSFVNNLFIDGANSDLGRNDIFRFGPGITVPFTTFVSGNRTFGGWDDTPETDLIDDDSGGNVTFAGAITGAIPTGFVSTTFGATDQNKRDFANLVCSNAGPRPTDRISQLQQICDQVDARFDGTQTATIIQTVGDHDFGYPSGITETVCDPTIANDCYTGQPAVPANPTAAGTHINAFWTAANDAHCDHMPAGATGC